MQRALGSEPLVFYDQIQLTRFEAPKLPPKTEQRAYRKAAIEFLNLRHGMLDDLCEQLSVRNIVKVRDEGYQRYDKFSAHSIYLYEERVIANSTHLFTNNCLMETTITNDRKLPVPVELIKLFALFYRIDRDDILNDPHVKRL